jgi:membrane protease YdiL (CAAX protease family)
LAGEFCFLCLYTAVQVEKIRSKEPHMNLKTWIARHPILTYIILTVIWSFSIWSFLFLYIQPGGLMKSPPPISFLFVVLGGFGPSLSGLFTTWLVYGREGLQALWNRVRIGRVGGWWFALLVIPAVTALTPLLRWLAGYPVDIEAMLRLLGPGIALGLTAGLMEEFGWRGFLLPHLLKRYSPFLATLLLGLIWGGLWHGYADYFGVGGRGVVSLVLIILLGPVLLTAWSFIITWVYERTQGSILLSYFMHASLSSSALIFGQTYATTTEEITWTAISTGLAVLAVVFIWLFVRRTDAKPS